MDEKYIILIILGILILIVALWYITTLNKLNTLLIKIDESFSGIDVALSKRYNALTQMIEVVKAYAKHEKEILFEVVELRNNMSLKEKVEANYIMDENFEKINAIVENYPELKASRNYMTLQKTIVDVEEHLQAARRFYNSNVSLYNQQIVSFPSSIVSKNKGMVKKDFFEADEIQKSRVDISL